MHKLPRRMTATIASTLLLLGASPAVASADEHVFGSSGTNSSESTLEWFIGQIIQVFGMPLHPHTGTTGEPATGMHSEHQTDFFYTVIDNDTIRMTVPSGDDGCYGVRGVVTTTPNTVGVAAVEGLRPGVGEGPCAAVASYPRIDVKVPGGINGRAITRITLGEDQLN
ncbi:hypothetical protein [Corynebacterium meridianum]|uniref:Uncharacterized protein n=1 Tax=Corynebacterium meridianum TaxID=2765363 RepID=A0A934MAK8_9CORY|nr:hypothetical protein [Corynebacterium meridianum]MBI8989153.1 hypothetical protein [Corynebacterium meridianum]MCK7676797.1 hypothetical protein [Corynebacterium meridianum]